ncbi:MAG: serine/threonine protein kinase [Myxococcales bacterium]|nr:serine/threonine protein kinase [Myxococcales bacterium]
MVQGGTSAPIERYVVLEFLSEGGMGAIYLGKKLGAGGFEKEVVLKQLLPEFTQQPEFIDLFLREARLSATLDHANIIHTIDLVTAGPEHFIVMEFLDGADLRTLAKRAKRRRAKLGPAAGIYVAREVLSALAYAHSKAGPDGAPLRLIHRDVSPSNILVSRNGEVKLTDFGIAKAATHTSIFYKVKGKIGYMSPEQAKGDPLDHRSDLYSLAVCLYELLTGERLFVAAGLTTSAEEIYSQPVELPSRKVAGLPPELDKVMLKALAIDANARYQTAGEFQEALLRCAHRNSLMISAPELATHLRQVCGPPEEWRDVGEQIGGHTAQLGGAGTEVYDAASGVEVQEGTEQLDARGFDDDDGGLDDLVGALAAARSDGGRRDRNDRSGLVDLGRLKRLELTSMVNIAELEQRGAKPLVDWGDLSARLDSEPGAAPLRANTATPLPLAERQPVPARREARLEAPPPRAGRDRLISAPPPAEPNRRRWLMPVIIGAALLVAAAVAGAIIASGPGVAAVPAGGAAPQVDGGADAAASADAGADGP